MFTEGLEDMNEVMMFTCHSCDITLIPLDDSALEKMYHEHAHSQHFFSDGMNTVVRRDLDEVQNV